MNINEYFFISSSLSVVAGKAKWDETLLIREAVNGPKPAAKEQFSGFSDGKLLWGFQNFLQVAPTLAGDWALFAIVHDGRIFAAGFGFDLFQVVNIDDG